MSFHSPVLLSEILALVPRARRVVDGTLGDGGHAVALLEQGAEVLGIDRDPEAIARARTRLERRPIRFLQGSVFDPDLIASVAEFGPDLILLDLGVSSRQLDDERLGFTFRPGAALDMRMSGAGPSAADLLNRTDPTELARWFREYGDEPRPGRLARVVARRRAHAPFRISDDLVNAIREAGGPRTGPPDFARLFQAVRIAVNNELGGLAAALPRLRDALVDGGVLACISYHSGEDRTVKHAFREWSRSCICPPELPVCRCRGRALGSVITRRPVQPSADEIAANPRARSARLRAFEVRHGGDGQG